MWGEPVVKKRENPIGETLTIPAKMSSSLNVLGFFNKNKSTLFASTTSDKVYTEVVIGHFNLFVEERVQTHKGRFLPI